MPPTPESLIEQHGKAVFGYLVNQLRSVEDAHDLYQEVCLRVVRSWRDFDPESPRGWIFTIARNLLTNFRTRDRKRRGRGLESVPEPMLMPPEEPEPNPRLLRLPGCLERLSPEQRVVVLGRAAGRSSAELAEELGLEVEKVYDHAANGMERLKRCLADGVPTRTNP